MSLKPTFGTITAYAGATLLAGLLVLPSFWAFSQIKQAARVQTHTFEVILHAEALLSALSDAETGQRGYVLTGDEAFLEPYRAVHDQVRSQLGELRQRSFDSSARQHLDAMGPLLDAKLVEMSRVIELRRHRETAAALALVSSGRGKRLMDAIRLEMGSFTRKEQGTLILNESAFHTHMGRLFGVILAVSLITLLVALTFAFLFHRRNRQRLKDQVHLETRHLLEEQEQLNRQLQEANATLQVSQDKLAVTLNSIGDAVIATDAQARIVLMNPVAEQLTGWTVAEATDQPVDEIFHIINQETRVPSVIPVMETLEHGTVQGLANHTLLIARDGTECAIADSCAPIHGPDHRVVGAVLVFRDVTEEYAAQQALRDSSALIQTVLNTVVDGIATFPARTGLIGTANPAVEHTFGYTGPELVGLSLGRLIPELAPGLVEASLAHFIASDGARAVGLGREVMGRHKDGRLFPLEIAASEMWLGGQRHITVLLRDITARKQVEEALVKAGALQNAIFNSANFSSIATDAKGVIQIFNVGAEQMLGYASADVMNKITPADFSDPQEVIARAEALSVELGTPIAPGFEALAFKASRGIEDIYELTLIHQDGTRFPAVVSVTALRDAQEAVIGYLLIATDNTARKEVEAERELLDQALKDKNTELLVAMGVADKANRAKSEFLSSMSHELRSPLNAILGFAQLMDSASPPPSPVQKGSIDRILHAGWYLLELINEILDLAVIESGKLSLSEEPVSVADVMIDCQSIIEPQAQQRGISLSFPRFTAPAFVRADRTRLKQVLINLLSNAIKYNRPGGSVLVECREVRPGFTRISVRDAGHGLSPDKLRQLFQPFNRLGQEHSTEEGTGIGLVMSKLLVELMGGAIGVESVVGVGSTFWYDLHMSVAPRHAEEPPQTVPTLPGKKTDPVAVHTLLYVEDNPANLDLVEQLIARRPDLHLISAGTGTLGIELARAQQPDLILMDINLPGISGVQALQLLKQDPLTARIPVVALSANAMVGDIQRGLEAGFFRYLTKPINVTEFMETMDATLEFALKQQAGISSKEPRIT